MKNKLSIKFKAAFLLLVFSLNTLIGFACAIGIDMTFNTSPHHDETTEISVHVHKDGKKHEHHSSPIKHHHEENSSSKTDKDDCCNDKVIKFQNLDKNLNQNSEAVINPPILVAILNPILGFDILNYFRFAPYKYIVRDFHPPPPDIRIAIQSFQI